MTIQIPLNDTPTTDDGKQIFLPNLFPGTVLVIYTGAGDDITNGIRLGGQEFEISSSAIEDVTFEFQFMEWVYLAGGGIYYEGAKIGDNITYKVYAPATVAANNPGIGAYDKLDLGGFNMYVPNTSSSGDWDLDLTEKLNPNVGFTKVTPVPSPDGTGFFDYDADTGLITLNQTQTGGYNLFDIPIDIATFINKVPMLGANTTQLTVPAIKPKKILPHWIHKITFHHEYTQPVSLSWFLYAAREKTT